jgi:endonuclease III
VSFFNNKAKNIFLTSEVLSKNPLENFDTLEKLVELP